MIERVVAIVAETFQVDPRGLGAETPFAAVPGWDSMNHLLLVAEVEAAFGVSLSTDEITGVARVGDLAAVLARRGS